MALPYKSFKSLTIDGETMGIDPEVGGTTTNRVDKNMPTANTNIYGAEITLTEPGLYIVFGAWIFGSSSTTGSRNLVLRLGVTNNGGTEDIGNSITTFTNLTGLKSQSRISGIFRVTETNAPRRFRLIAVSDKTSSEFNETNITAVKLLSMGG